MIALKKILVPTDFSPSSNQAFAFALTLARRMPALPDVHLLHDIETPVETITGANIVREEIEAEVEDSREKIRLLLDNYGDSRVPVEVVLKESTSPARSILVYAEENHMDLIVMGTHGREGLKEQILGSVAERVVGETSCPVVTTRVSDNKPIERVSRIVVPVDFSEKALESLRYAIDLARVFDARISLLHTDTGESLDTIREKLRDLYSRAGGDEKQMEDFVSSSNTVDALLTLCDNVEADLIVMWTHGHKSLKHAFTANKADEVIRKAPCPVLTLRR